MRRKSEGWMEENYLGTSLLSRDLSETGSSSLGLAVVRAGLTAQVFLLSSSGSAKSEEQVLIVSPVAHPGVGGGAQAWPASPTASFPPQPFCPVYFSLSTCLCVASTLTVLDFVGGCCLFQAFQEKSCDRLSPLPWLVVVFFVTFLFLVLNSRLLGFCFNLFLSEEK